MNITPSGITINFAGSRDGGDDSRPVVARIVGFPDDRSAPKINREMVVPAGQQVDEQLPHGLYNVQLTLPSGRIIQRSVTIAADTSERIEFLEDFASGSGFSLQEAVGRSDRSRLVEAAIASGNTSGADYDSAVRRASVVAAHDTGTRPLRATRKTFRGGTEAVAMPIPPAHPFLHLELGADPEAAGSAPPALPGAPLEPVESRGDSALWRIAVGDAAPPTRATRRWARIALLDGRIELASLPLPWFCAASNEFSPAEVLVDPAREGCAAASVAVRDARLAGLLAYLDRGQAGAAKPMLAALEADNVIEQTIYDKVKNPLAACAAAYVALAVYDPREAERWDQWLENCMNLFPEVPDAAILHARRLLLRPIGGNDNERAASALRAACAAGVPFFSAGVLLLREMLLQLSPDFADLEALADRAGRIAGRVDPGQAFTVLRYAAPKIDKLRPEKAVNE